MSEPLAYLSTPYTKYWLGQEQAYIDACRLSARLLNAGIKVFCPIAHSHPIDRHGDLDTSDRTFWMAVDRPFMEKCDLLLVAHMEGWEDSEGMVEEIEFFEKAGKPIWDLNCDTLLMVKRTYDQTTLPNCEPSVAASEGT